MLSVIIPCYNCESTISDTLNSLEGNDIDYEVLLINDGSTDNSLDVINAYAKSSSMNIRVITQENQGVSIARNRGIEESVGEYILFLDADDMFADKWLETVSRYMSTGVDVMACLRTRKLEDLSCGDGKEARQVSPIELMEAYTYSKRFMGMCGFVFKRDILKDIRFAHDVKYAEDIEFVTMYLANCKTAIQYPYYCLYYRQHVGSTTWKVTYAQTDVIIVAERVGKYLTDNQHPFEKRFNEYMPNRAIFCAAHRFARAKNKKLYTKLLNEYNVRDAMIFISKDADSDIQSRLAAKAYLISPYLYYLICVK